MPSQNLKYNHIILIIITSLFSIGCATIPSRALDTATHKPAEETPHFDFNNVQAKAEALARENFEEPKKVPEFLLKLNYDQWRDIRFKAEKALWKNEPSFFQLQFFHPGFYYDRPVQIHFIENGEERTMPFSESLFDYGKNHLEEQIPPDLGFAGFRIHAPFHTKNYFDEAAVFLGASYFRAVADKQQYGLSARGLAIDTALSSGEEFPFFKEFWISKPGPGDEKITLFALLDSPSVAGAYRFIIHPGKETILEVTASLWARKEAAKWGLAPLNSMFLFGENSPAGARIKANDFRPEVHDSDGLLIESKNEWLWRPVMNPEHLFVNAFQVDALKGFGLLQRDGQFDHYQDLESRYDLRPSLWITPDIEASDKGLWEKGHVELIQIPAEKETSDNIVSFWVPEQKVKKGDRLNFSYVMKWYFAAKENLPLGRVATSHILRQPDKKNIKFILDFEGAELESLPAGTLLVADVSLNRNDCKIQEKQVYKNAATGGWRLEFEVATPGSPDSVIELRAFLKKGEAVVSETWSYAVFE